MPSPAASNPIGVHALVWVGGWTWSATSARNSSAWRAVLNRFDS